jgi:methionyl-tRNA formyltransferase
MRVSVMGQAAFGEAVLKRLLDDGIEVAGVSAPPPPPGGRADALWAAAEAAGLPLVPTGELKAEAGRQSWRALEADLCAMAFVTEILPVEVFTIPRRGTIQYHPSLLPLHRGIASINWPIIFGEKQTGLTIFWPDEGVDTGPILLQKTVDIGAEDTVGSLYFQRLFPMGIDAMAEAVRLVEQGIAPRIEQDHALATYEPACRDEHARIHWYEPAARVSALIRGCNPQPGAWTMFGDAKLRIFDCKLSLEPVAGRPGRVLRVDGEGFDVRLNGGVLRVARVQPEGSPKRPAGEWAAEVGLEAGARLR